MVHLQDTRSLLLRGSVGHSISSSSGLLLLNWDTCLILLLRHLLHWRRQIPSRRLDIDHGDRRLLLLLDDNDGGQWNRKIRVNGWPGLPVLDGGGRRTAESAATSAGAKDSGGVRNGNGIVAVGVHPFKRDVVAEFLSERFHDEIERPTTAERGTKKQGSVDVAPLMEGALGQDPGDVDNGEDGLDVQQHHGKCVEEFDLTKPFPKRSATLKPGGLVVVNAHFMTAFARIHISSRPKYQLPVDLEELMTMTGVVRATDKSATQIMQPKMRTPPRERLTMRDWDFSSSTAGAAVAGVAASGADICLLENNGGGMRATVLAKREQRIF